MSVSVVYGVFFCACRSFFKLIYVPLLAIVSIRYFFLLEQKQYLCKLAIFAIINYFVCTAGIARL